MRPDTLATFAALRALGVVLTIDDFGEGYSALNYLRRLPIHGLKLSQHFLQGVPSNALGRRHLPGGGRHRAQPGPGRGRRGRGNDGAARLPAGPGHRGRPGLPVQPRPCRRRQFASAACASQADGSDLPWTFQIRPIDASDDAAIAAIIRTRDARIRRHRQRLRDQRPGGGLDVAGLCRAALAPISWSNATASCLAAAASRRWSAATATPANCARCISCPKLRGLGAGAAMMARCLDAARGFGFTQCYLETLRGMDAAMRLYERTGFTPHRRADGRDRAWWLQHASTCSSCCALRQLSLERRRAPHHESAPALKSATFRAQDSPCSFPTPAPSITGGVSGLGLAVARHLVAAWRQGRAVRHQRRQGRRRGRRARRRQRRAISAPTSPTRPTSPPIVAAAKDFLGGLNAAINCAGILGAGRVLGKDGAMPLQAVRRHGDGQPGRQLQRRQGRRRPDAAQRRRARTASAA